MDDDTKSDSVPARKRCLYGYNIEDLQEVINREGVISEYQNGANQWGTKNHLRLKYITL